MCESWLYKYKVLMMAVKQSKEGGGKEGWSHFTAEKKVQIRNPGVIDLLFTI